MNRMMRLTSWLLLFIFPMAVMAADVNAAMLSGSGVVKVNGAVVPTSATVYSGDKVATEKNSTATLTAKSTVMVLANDSAVLYKGKQVQMEKGRMLVTAQPGTEVYFAKLTITPQSAAKFQVGQSGAKLAVVAFEGALNVTDGSHTTVLPPGQMLTRVAEDRDCDPNSKDYDKSKCEDRDCDPKSKHYNKKKCGAAYDQGSGSSSSSSSSSSGATVSGTTAATTATTTTAAIPGWVAATIVVGAIGGTVGGLAAAGTFTSSKPASASTP
jgi:hypothetical protein